MYTCYGTYANLEELVFSFLHVWTELKSSGLVISVYLLSHLAGQEYFYFRSFNWQVSCVFYYIW